MIKYLYSIIILASLNVALAAPKLVTRYRLTPSAELRIVFDNAMVAKNTIGKNQPNNILSIKPEWKGRILWKAENIAIFQPLEAAKLNTIYTFHTKKGLSNFNSEPIKVSELGKKSTPKFSITNSRNLDSLQNEARPRTFLRFNDDISSTQLAPYFYYQSEDGKRAAAQVIQAKYSDINSSYYSRTSWSKRSRSAINKTLGTPQKNEILKADTTLSNCIVVRPIETLPSGKGWRLSCLQSAPNLSKTTRTLKIDTRTIGNKSPFKCIKATAVNYPNQPHFIRVRFNSNLITSTVKSQLDEILEITPTVPNIRYNIKNNYIDIHGNLNKQDNYYVTLKPSLKSQNGLILSKQFSSKIKFTHVKPSIAIPSLSRAQLSLGQRKYPIETVNLDTVKVRIKALTMQQAVIAYQGYNQFLAGQKKNKDKSERKRITLPFGLINGSLVYDHEYKLKNTLDTSKTLVLNWDKILPTERKNLIFFIDIEGTPKSVIKDSTHHVQSFLQLTDIGLAWKQDDAESFLYCYSCNTGKPLANVEIKTYSKDTTVLKTFLTNQQGIAHIPHHTSASHLSASLGSDSYITPWRRKMSHVSLWRFPVKYDYYKFKGWKREALIFTDRKLYKPGERARIKGIVRERKDNQHRIPSQRKATLSILDPAQRTLFEEEIILSANGSFDHEINLPSSNLGSYEIKLTFEIPENQRKGREERNSWVHNWMLEKNSRFNSYFSVQEFRRNAFKIESSIEKSTDKSSTIAANIKASYYMGTAVAKGTLDWFLTVSSTGFYPEKFREYYFGNHLEYDPYYWDYYYGYNNGTRYNSRDSQKQNGTLELTEDGNASFNLTVQPPKFPSPQKVKIISEVTDGREQTLTKTSSITIHPSSHYLGISRTDSLLRVGNSNEIRFLAVDKKGNHSKIDFETTVTINHIVYDSVKVRSGDGKITVKNNKKEEIFLTKELFIKAGKFATLTFNPEKAGKYIINIESKDPDGNKISSATRVHVYGSDEYPWAVGTGMKIELAPEKKHYQPGDNARILVKTPIEGTALVTIERSGVKRHYLRELKMSNPIIEVPIEHEDTPNVYVSVLLIRGSSVSTHQYKQPMLRLGYCNLSVENKIDEINITLDTPENNYRPGETVTLSGTLTDYKNQAISGAEITFYGEDNGVLDVVDYKTPQPLRYFNSAIALAVESGTSLSTFLQEMAAEDMDMINNSILNKGYTIGGGGDGGGAIDGLKRQIRKNFDPCAFWNPTLVTDSNGKFSFSFRVPERLTSYRVMAVATAGADQFGSSSSEITVNKPLMLEPMAPRFANEGDNTTTKLYIANNSKYEATWKVELKTNSLNSINELRNADTSQHVTRQVQLKPGASTYLDFVVSHLNTGNAKWTWSAEPVKVMNQQLTSILRDHLSDAIESKFEIIYPRPILKGTKFKKLTSTRQDLLSGIDSELFNGRGHIEVSFSNNLLSKSRGAARHLLKYPYGCAEQTTSSLMPWFAVNELKPYVPEFKKQSNKNILKTIQKGVDRLLSMQTIDGGLAYWPGGDASQPWATTYGGYALILAKKHGAKVPDEAINRIIQNLSTQIHIQIKQNTSWSLETAARALYTISLIGKAKQSDLNFMYKKHDTLNSSARAYLAMAMHTLNPNSKEAKQLILIDKKDSSENHWMRYNTHSQSLLTALCQIAPNHEKTHQLMEKIVRSTDKRNHWGTTWANSSTVNAMAAYAKVAKSSSTNTEIMLEIDGKIQTVRLSSQSPMKTITIPLDGKPRILSSSATLAFCNTVVYSKPILSKPTATSKNGITITKTFYRIRKDGKREALINPTVGDLVEIELEVTFKDSLNYVVIDDPLPGTFESINSDFASQSTHIQGKENRNWRISNQELRNDRALFFLNRSWAKSTDTISYLARITSSGEITIPAAKAEAMYDPESYGLSASSKMICQPRE